MTTKAKAKKSTKRAPTVAPLRDMPDRIADVDPGDLHDHPQNRDPGDVKSLADSIADVGMLEPITVRKLAESSQFVSDPDRPEKAGDLQVVFGGRRVAAARALKLPTIPAIVRDDLDDAAALVCMAVENAKREDLDPIEQARHLARLCEPLDKGGAGLTRAQAAATMDLQTGQAASNLIRLLELPAEWQALVQSGAVPASFARALLPYKSAPALLARILDDYRADAKDKWERENWQTRDTFAESVEFSVRQHTRALDKAAKHWSQIDNKAHAPLVGKTPEELEELEAVEIKLKGDDKPRLYATNPDAFERMQAERIREQLAKKKKKKTTGKKDGATEADRLEEKEKAKIRAGQLNRRISDWRHHWIRHILADRLTEELALRILLDTIGPANASGYDLTEALYRANRNPSFNAIGDAFAFTVDVVEEFLEPGATSDKPTQARPPFLPQDALDRYARYAAIDLAAEWQAAQASELAEERERLLDLFHLYPTDQLEEVARSIDLELPAGTKKKKIEAIRAALEDPEREVPKPKAISEIPAARRKK